MFCKPEPGFAELEKKLKSFSQKSAVLKEVLLEFKGELEAPPVGVPGDLNSSCWGARGPELLLFIPTENLRFELENDTGEGCWFFGGG